MNVILGFALLGAVVLAGLLLYGITLLISMDTAYVQKDRPLQKRVSGIILAVSVVLNSVVILLGQRLLLRRWNPLATAKELATLSFSYQDLKFYGILLIFCTVCAVGIGLLLRWILPKLLGRKYGRGYLTLRRKAALLLICAAFCAAGIGAMFCSFNGVHQIVINEVGAYNKSVGFGETGVICDYVELYNKGSLDWSLRQMYLSDDANDLKKWEIPASTVEAKEYALIPLDTAGFSISSKGKETLYLSDDLGRVLDAVLIPELKVNMAYSRKTDGGDIWETGGQTPGEVNAQPGGRTDVQVQLSHKGGFYPEAFYLSMETDAGYDIYYTLDGSVPDTDSIRYEEPVYVYDRSAEPNVWRSLQRVVLDWKNYTPDLTPVSKGFVVRAAAISDDGDYGEVTTATYFVNLPEYASKAVVSLVADPEDLFGEDGIYVTGKAYDEAYLAGGSVDVFLGSVEDIEANFIKEGRSSEIPAHMDYFAGEDTFQQNVGIRISGSSARRGAIKRFSVYARTEYSGSRVFDRELFEGVTTRRVQIREFYINAACQQIVADRAVATQRGIPVTLFVNGEYWDDSYIVEKYDGHFFQENYGIREDNIVINKNNIVNDWDPEDTALHQEIYRFLESHDLSIPEHYAAFGELVDIQSYIDFMCTNIYMNNRDFSEKANIVLWRAREVSSSPYEDGKWRFALYDMDAVGWSGVTDRIDQNMFTHEAMYGPINTQQIYVALKANPDYRKQFVLTFMDLVNNNFRYENATAILDAYDPSFDTSEFHEFYRERPKYIVPYMAEEFALTGSLETITLGRNNDGGAIKLNTAVPDLTDGSWSGQYYTDYPVTVTAVPERGYRFVRWEGDITSTQPELEITLPEGGITINAIFEKETAS